MSAMDPPVTVIEDDPGAAVTVNVGSQPLIAMAGLATTSPVGRGSVKLTLVKSPYPGGPPGKKEFKLKIWKERMAN